MRESLANRLLRSDSSARTTDASAETRKMTGSDSTPVGAFVPSAGAVAS
jgi:hypothetical protein